MKNNELSQATQPENNSLTERLRNSKAVKTVGAIALVTSLGLGIKANSAPEHVSLDKYESVEPGSTAGETRQEYAQEDHDQDGKPNHSDEQINIYNKGGGEVGAWEQVKVAEVKAEVGNTEQLEAAFNETGYIMFANGTLLELEDTVITNPLSDGVNYYQYSLRDRANKSGHELALTKINSEDIKDIRQYEDAETTVGVINFAPLEPNSDKGGEQLHAITGAQEGKGGKIPVSVVEPISIEERGI